jgi:hypothetical protein
MAKDLSLFPIMLGLPAEAGPISFTTGQFSFTIEKSHHINLIPKEA